MLYKAQRSIIPYNTFIMGVSKSLRFTEVPALVQEFPRMTWDELDLAFYTEDEIGDMRHSAFMIECGLEEEDWTGPDVEPLPWPKKEDIVRSQEKQDKAETTKPSHWDDPAEDSDLEEEDLKGPASPKPPSSTVNPLAIQRSMSMDMNWTDTVSEESRSPNGRMWRRSRRSSIETTTPASLADLAAAADGKLDEKRTGISVSLARTEKPKYKKRINSKTSLLEKPKLKATKSADLERMRDDDPQRSPKMLMRTNSGSRRKLDKKKYSPFIEKRRMKKVSLKKEKSLDRSSRSDVSSSSHGDSFLSGLDLRSNGSDRSIDTNSDCDCDIDNDSDDEIKMEFFRYMDRQPNRKSGVKAYTLYRAEGDPPGHYVGTALVIA